ncbi:hypothetical protein [Aeromonas caviae]|uniref:hypothetical protein n=1 Tax=Aeromonas caviae TaxID=648 RepID=UPI003F74324E
MFILNFFIKGLKLFFIRYFYIKFSRAENSKKALVSFIIHPFYQNKSSTYKNLHPNVLEARAIVDTLLELGFNVTIVDYRRKKIFGKYDLAFGFGDCFEFCVKNGLSKRSFLYSTGSPFPEQNNRALTSYVRAKKNLGFKSADFSNFIRLTEAQWYHQLLFSDAVIAIGNKFTAGLFDNYGHTVKYLPAVAYVNYRSVTELHKFKENSHKTIVWFGGKGSIHKGLDLCISAALKMNFNLVIAGELTSEIVFFENYLVQYDNIKYLGFVDIFSPGFISILDDATFAILPSCSEGTATSLVSLVSSGGLIPIITKECGIDLDDDFIEIKQLTCESVEHAIDLALKINSEELLARSIRLQEKFIRKYNYEEFCENLHLSVKELLGEKI